MYIKFNPMYSIINIYTLHQFFEAKVSYMQDNMVTFSKMFKQITLPQL